MRQFLLVVLAASVWTWAQSAQRPALVPDQRNCFVHGINLEQNVHDVYWSGLRRPDQTLTLPSGERLWTWESQSAPDLRKLRVTFRWVRIAKISGTDLKLDSHTLRAGDSLTRSHFLGSPTRIENGRTIWVFPEVEVSVYADRGQRVTQVEIERPAEISRGSTE